MLNHIEWLTRRRHRAVPGRGAAATAVCRRWWSDPLSHPDLQRMSLDQLADLPFDPARFSVAPDARAGDE